MATGYEPLDRLKPVAHDIWIIDGPAIRFYGMPFSTRATVVRLASGALWVHSPTKMSEPLRSEVEALGPVAHLVAPNWIHYAYVQDWANLWPEARTWAAPGVAERAAKHGVPGDFEQTLRQEPPPDDVERMIGWNPEAVILAHGRWYVQDGVKELRRAFRWVL